MNIWWIVLVLFILAAIAVLVPLLRRSKPQPTLEDASPDRDFGADRETSRMGNLSAEDQAWQAASQAKDRASREQTPPAT